MVQRLSINSTGRIYTGQYRLEVQGKIWGSGGRKNIIEKTNNCIDFNAPPAVLQRALETVSSIDHVSITRVGDGTASSNYGYTYDIVYDGKLLNYGDLQELKPVHIGSHGCDAWKSDGKPMMNVESVKAAQQGAIPEIATVSSVGDTSLSGKFSLSVDFIGPLTKALPGIVVTVYEGTNMAKVVSGTSDVRTMVVRGDKIKIGDEVFIVHLTDSFTCDTIPLSTYHTAGAHNAHVYVMETHVGLATSNGGLTISTFSDFTSQFRSNSKDYIQIGTYGNKYPNVFKVATINANSIQLSREFNLSSSTIFSVYKRQTVDIQFNSNSSEMKSKLEALPGVGSVDVVRTGPTKNDEYVWTITFTSLRGASESNCETGVPCLASYTTASLSGTNARVDVVVTRPGIKPVFFSALSQETSSFIPEVHEITTAAAAADLNGTFTIIFSGPGVPFETNATVGSNITAEDLRYVLEKMHSIGRVKTSHEQMNFGSKWTITYLTQGINIPELKVDGAQLTGSSAKVTSRTVVDGSWPQRQFTVPVLTKGKNYYLRVSAKNSEGYGPTTEDVQNMGEGVVPFVRRVVQQPLAPYPISLKQISSSQIEVRWADADAQGTSIEKYKIEWWTSKQTKEVQNVYLTNTKPDTMGYFTLVFRDHVSTRLAHNATAKEVKFVLENLPAIDQVEVQQYKYGLYGYKWVVTFSQEFVGDNERFAPPDATLNVDYSGLVGTKPEMNIVGGGQDGSVDGKLPGDYGVYIMDTGKICGTTLDSLEQGTCAYGTHEVQTILTSSDTEIRGSFKLVLRGMRTSKMPYNASAAQVKEALEALESQREVEVTRIPIKMGYSWFVTFASDNGPMDTMVAESDYLVGEESVVAVYDTIILTSNAQKNDISGHFRIHIGDEYTEQLAYDVPAETMRIKLELLDGVGRVEITRQQANNTYTEGMYGFVWHIVCKIVTAPLDTTRAVPQSDWRGTGVTLHVQRPLGIKRNTFVIGSISEVQTITVKAAQGRVITGGYQLKYDDETTSCLPWNISNTDMETELEKLNKIDEVSIVRTGDGSISSAYGYVFTITFWGTLPTADNVLPLGVVTGCQTFQGGQNHEVYQFTARTGSAIASYNHMYTALKEDTLYNVRVTAMNGQGYGESAYPSPITTAKVGTYPSAPTSVTLARKYNSTALAVNYMPPYSDGGDPIIKYRLEWDSSPTFDTVDFRSAEIEKKHEIQIVRTSFKSVLKRSGTFLLTWGGRTTDPLDWDTSAPVMAVQMQIISGGNKIGQNPIKVTRRDYGNGHEWRITFTQLYGNMRMIETDYTLLKGYDPRVQIFEAERGVNDIFPQDYSFEVQTITTQALSGISGSFVLEFEGKKTADIMYNETARQFKLKCEALTTIYTANVYAMNTGPNNGRTWEIHFTHLNHETIQGAGNFGLILADTQKLQGNSAEIKIKEKVVGSRPFSYWVGNLIAGRRYFLRVAAFNSRGYGPYSYVTSDIPRTHPAIPNNPALSVYDGNSLRLAWNEPLSNNGNSVSQYKVEWYTKNGNPEVQVVTTSARDHIHEIQFVETKAKVDNIGGWFYLTFKGETTKPIRFNATATGKGSVKEALELMSTIGKVNVVRALSQTPLPGTVSVDQNTSYLKTSVDCRDYISSDEYIWVAGEQFVVTNHTNDQFTSSRIPLGKVGNASQIKGVFQGESVTDVTAFRWAYGFRWTVTFSHGHVGDQPPLTASGSTRPSEGWRGTDVTLNVWTVLEGLQPISGSFRLEFRGHSTRSLEYNAAALEMKDALESLVTVGTVDVERNINGNGFNWVITFTSELGNLPSITPHDVQLTGPSARMSTATQRQGIAPENWNSTIVSAITGKTDYDYTIRELTQGVPYLARVTAKNSEGYGRHALSLPLSEIPREKPPVPQNVVLSVLNDNNVKITWSHPWKTGGAKVTQYKIEWDRESDFRNIGTSGYTHIFTEVDQGITEQERAQIIQDPTKIRYFYNVPNLLTNKRYYFRISAYNDKGFGPTTLPKPVSAIPHTRQPGRPYSVDLMVVSTAQIQVDWTAPDPQLPLYSGDGGRPITHYLIEWDTDWENPPLPASQKFDVSQGQQMLSYIIGGRNSNTGEESTVLNPELSYFVRISAYNADGYGNSTKSLPLQTKPADRVPYEPRSTTAFPLSRSSIESGWNVPIHDGGQTLTDFEVEWDTSNAFSNKTGEFGSRVLPIENEFQSIATEVTVTNEVQTIGATVGVINERQRFTTAVEGVNEVQTITSRAQPVVPEIQTITTYATDVDEVQEIKTEGINVDEVQSIRTDTMHVDEVQTIEILGTDEDEVQTVRIEDSLKTQEVGLIHSGSSDIGIYTNEVQELTIAEPYRTFVFKLRLTSNAKANNAKISKGRVKFKWQLKEKDGSGGYSPKDTWFETACSSNHTMGHDTNPKASDAFKNLFKMWYNSSNTAITRDVFVSSGETDFFNNEFEASLEFLPDGEMNYRVRVNSSTTDNENAYYFNQMKRLKMEECGTGVDAFGVNVAPITDDDMLGSASFQLRFDTTLCKMCGIRAAFTTQDILPSQPQTVGLELLNLKNIFRDSNPVINPNKISYLENVNVTYSSEHTANNGFVTKWRITFVGDNVRGNVPQLTVVKKLKSNGDFTDTIDTTDQPTISTVTEGQMGGFSLKYAGTQLTADAGSLYKCIPFYNSESYGTVGNMTIMKFLNNQPGVKVASVTKSDADSPNIGFKFVIVFEKPERPLKVTIDNENLCRGTGSPIIKTGGDRTGQTTTDFLTFFPQENYTNIHGLFQLRFDTFGLTPATTCNLCSLQSRTDEDSLTSMILPTDIFNFSKSLNNLNTINNGITRVWSGLVVTDDAEYIEFNVTFNGQDVEGNVPLLQYLNHLTGDGPTISIRTAKAGNEIDPLSVFSLSLDDNNHYPAGISNAAGTQFTTYNMVHSQWINVTAIPMPTATSISGQSVEEKLRAMQSIGTVNVTRTQNKQKAGGYIWTVTFTSNDGNLSPFICNKTLVGPSKRTSGDSSGLGIDCVVKTMTNGNFLGGDFTVSYPYSDNAAGTITVYTTPKMPYNVDDTTLKNNLEALTPKIGSLSVSRERFNTSPSWNGGYTWHITFLTLPGDSPVLTVSNTGLNSTQANNVSISLVVGSGDSPVSGNERKGNTVKGVFQLEFRGQKTTNISTKANATEMKEALEALSTIDNVTVSRGAPDPARGYAWVVTFNHPKQGGNVPQLKVPTSCGANNSQTCAFLTGTQIVVGVTTVTQGSQLQGSFRVYYLGHHTGLLAHDVSDIDLATQLMTLPNIGNVTVSREWAPQQKSEDVGASGYGATVGPNQVQGYTWIVTFNSHMHDGIDHGRDEWPTGTYGPAASPLYSTAWKKCWELAKNVVRYLRAAKCD
jgi:hypothetical protein